MTKGNDILINVPLKKNLKKLREEEGSTISETAKNIGISLSYYFLLEDPKSNKQPSLKMLERIAQYYNIAVAELFKTE